MGNPEYLFTRFTFSCDQPVHNSGSSGYSSLPRNDNIFSMTSSSEDNCSAGKMQEHEEETCSKARPVSTPTLHQISRCLFKLPLNFAAPVFLRGVTITCDDRVAVSQRTFQEICKGIHLQKNQEQQANKADIKKINSGKISSE